MLQSIFRTILFYGLLILVIRLMGKRQLGQLEPSEFVVTMLVANLAAIPLEEMDLPLRSGLIPIVTVLALELILTFLSLRSVKLRKLLCGKPVILVENGKPIQKNLRQTRVTLDELTSHLRQKDVLDITTVQYAILETDGNLSVFPFPKEAPATAKEAGIQVKKQYIPLTIIEDGFLSWDNLQKAGKDQRWLNRVLEEKGTEVSATFLLTVDGSDRINWVGKEQNS
jgi:uncharacterized membrane protein YcaP (DUF421 family)